MKHTDAFSNEALKQTVEYKKLKDHSSLKANWKLWGPYLSERGWGTVREDYSKDGEAWDYFPHEHARSRVYRWNEDGIAGISDRNQYLCFALALWNGKDPILKERMFGLTGQEGNHGEDVKEYYFYLDNTPTHSYMKMLYKYPQKEYPYSELIEENKRRNRNEPEYELLDTGIFNNNEYFDVFVEYAKENEKDILIKITICNRGPTEAQCDVLPTIWFRNTWNWGYEHGPMNDDPMKPVLKQTEGPKNTSAIKVEHPQLDNYYLYAEDSPDLIFTNNETNFMHLYHIPNKIPYVKDAFHRYIINGDTQSVDPHHTGTKAAAVYSCKISAGGEKVFKLRLTNLESPDPFQGFDEIFQQRISDANEFYKILQNPRLDDDECNIQRQAAAGLLWSKQLYYYDIDQWIKGDPSGPPPPGSRKKVRNHDWSHFVSFDVISMPDKWEYPWFATWDLAFHCIALAVLDPDFAKRQLTLMTREWYMHPNGQMPAYEWNFSDVNPPVHAWATWRVYKIDAKMSGKPDYEFLEGIFHKLIMNFTWWINRKDKEGNNVFQGGFLGLDNISVFDRSKPLPTGGHIDQSDGTAWMGFYCGCMMKIALELSKKDPIYQDTATKFVEHYLRISSAMLDCAKTGHSLWDDKDGFFYDVLHLPDDSINHLKVRSIVGLLPLFAIESLDAKLSEISPTFSRRLDWFVSKNPLLRANMACVYHPGEGSRRHLAILTEERLRRVLSYLLDEKEFLSPYGIRSLSKYHKEHPYQINVEGQRLVVDYEPAESQTPLFGGNSNWRGPIWFPINYLLIESLQKYHYYYGDSFKIDFPTGSGIQMNLGEVAKELSKRLIKIFVKDKDGKRPVNGNIDKFQNDPYWKDLLLFYEYFNGDNGIGLGASHQTGWTGLLTKIIQQSGGKDLPKTKEEVVRSCNIKKEDAVKL